MNARMATMDLFLCLLFSTIDQNTASVILLNKPVGGGNCVNTSIVEGSTSIGLPSMCHQRVDSGPCGRDLIRVYFDYKSGRCKHFSYSGCGGNANRFVSIKNCYHLCSPGLRQKIIETKAKQKKRQEEEEKYENAVAKNCPQLKPKKVKMNVTSVQEILVDI